MERSKIIRYTLREVLGLVGVGVALFWSAGRIDWWAAWGALAVMGGWMVGTAIIIFRFNPGLLAERLGSIKEGKSWDTAIVSTLGLIQLVRYIVAGLDQRYHWTVGFSGSVQVAALILCSFGYALFTWATAVNTFFSRFVRIQSERGHNVVSSGPYRFLRHPAYAGAILYELAVPFLLASWWALIPSGLSTILLILRTALEDATLQEELPGYRDYAGRIRYRLLPGVW